MGADLCGYVLVGPRRLTRRKVRAAIARLGRLRRQAEAGQTDQEPLHSVARRANDELGLDVEDCLSASSDSPSRALADFVAMWNDGGYRDQMVRSLPGDRRRKIVVVGERTWGDGPQEGSAWYLAETVDRLGLFEILGLE
jgi:hypothetical protein